MEDSEKMRLLKRVELAESNLKAEQLLRARWADELEKAEADRSKTNKIPGFAAAMAELLNRIEYLEALLDAKVPGWRQEKDSG